MISICIPVFNEEENVARIADHVRETSLWRGTLDRELVFCVNGSLDQSAAIARRIAANDPQVKVIELKEKGKNHAWNALVAQSSPKSEFLFFVDADVIVKPDTFLEFAKELRENPSLALVGGKIIPLPQRGLRGLVSIQKRAHGKVVESYGEAQPWLNGACYAMRRSDAIKIKMPKDQRIEEDQFVELAFIGRFKIVPKADFYQQSASVLDYAKQEARHFTSQALLARKYPGLFARRGKLYRPKISRWKKLQSMTPGEMVGAGMMVLAKKIGVRRGKRLLKTGKDTWPKVKSTKKRLALRRK